MNRSTLLLLAVLTALAAASPAAAQTAPVLFRTPIMLSTVVNSSFVDWCPTISGDGLTLYFTSSRTGGMGGRDIWMTTRLNLASPWSTPVPVPSLNSVQNEDLIDVRDDHLEFILNSDRTGTVGGYDLWWSSRANTSAPWSTPVNITPLNTTGTEWDPALSADGLELYFTAQQRPEGGQGTYSIYRVTRTNKSSTTWSSVAYLASLDSTSSDHSPCLSPDGLTMLWSSDRPGGTGSSDFYRAVRPDRLTTVWTVLGEQKELNGTGWDHNAQFSGDGFSLYYTQSGTNNLWVAHRILPLCIVDGTQTLRPGVELIKIGQTFRVSCRRDPGDIGIIVGALFSIPPFSIPGIQGQLELNLGSLIMPPQVGFVSNMGRYSIPFGVPNDPRLDGLRVHFQTAAQDQASPPVIYLSNRVEVVVLK